MYLNKKTLAIISFIASFQHLSSDIDSTLSIKISSNDNSDHFISLQAYNNTRIGEFFLSGYKDKHERGIDTSSNVSFKTSLPQELIESVYSVFNFEKQDGCYLAIVAKQHDAEDLIEAYVCKKCENQEEAKQYLSNGFTSNNTTSLFVYKDIEGDYTSEFNEAFFGQQEPSGCICC